MPPPSSTATYGSENPVSAIGSLEAGTGNAVLKSNGTSGVYNVGWFSDWRAAGLIGVAIVCSIIAIAAMVGKAFNLPEIKAFANNEIKQAVISVLLIATLIALVAFFDQTATYAIHASDLPVDCNVPEPCYVAAAKAYLTTIIDIGKGYSRDNLKESIEKMRRATYGYNVNMNLIYFAYAGFSIRFNAGESLVAERHGALFSQTSKILASLTAQRYFIDVVAFGIAPLFILLGIVLRTFFFTRKLGGLLLAVAVSLFIVYPLTYAFAWYTLNVTVYGERTLAVADPFCPNECTATYPAAFFTDPSTGQLVQFPTIQSIVRAGINKDNWNSQTAPDLNGDGKSDFPGLVACRSLTSIGIRSETDPQNPSAPVIAPNSCSECPDYCRDVPFPSSMPGCDIAKCASCNPGCKIVRQRLNCQTDPDCKGKCPDICRTNVPTENKCFNDEKGGVMPANLSVSCGGCGKYPAWCRFMREEPVGSYSLVYPYTVTDSGDEINIACKNLDTDLTCPKACFYTSRIGATATCDSICSVKNANGQATVCPAECRVDEALNDPAWMGLYDIDPPNFAKICSSSPEIIAACDICKAHPECLIVAGPPPENCSSYPIVNDAPQMCLACPDYCRRTSFGGMFIADSNVERDPSTSKPAVCDKAVNPDINCDTTGAPPACDASCRTDPTTPLMCRTLDVSAGQPQELCRACPEAARFRVRYVPGEYSATCGNAQASPPGGSAILFLGAQGAIRLSGVPAAPIMASSRISSPAYSTGITGFCKASDANADDMLTYSYTWEINEEYLYASGSTTVPALQGTEVNVGSIPASALTVGDTWTLTCTAYDASLASAPLASPISTIINPPPSIPLVLASQYNCDSGKCGAACMRDPIVVDLPTGGACYDEGCTLCPFGCRVGGPAAAYLDPVLCAPCATFRADHPECFVAPAQTWPVCSEYLGNGGPACHSLACSVNSNSGDCSAQSGCAWNDEGGYCDGSGCPGLAEGACTGACTWTQTVAYSKINDRGGENPNAYSYRDSCKQCPEQCRLDGYTGNCGVENNGNNDYVDCSLSACPSACRIPEPLDTSEPPNPACLAYPEGGKSCTDCPALCRRSSDIMSYVAGCPVDKCALSDDPAKGCMDICRLPDPPVKPCEGCFDCNMDCTYYPAIRTDCGEICSDAALAGPVDISPDDFIKKLSGAETSADGEWARSIGILYVPSVVLPLFCIVIVIAFVRILSPILGGDIEIPGIGRII
jgi:hypothetical protein